MDDALLKGDFQIQLRQAIEGRRRTGAIARGGEPPWVLLTQGAHSLNKVVLLSLAPDGKVEFVIKVPRTSAADGAVDREAAVLEEVHAICGDMPGIPRVLFSGSCAGVRMVGETSLHGVPLSQLASRIDYRTLGMKAANWQARLVHRRASRSGPSWWLPLVEPILTFMDGPLAASVDSSLIRVTKAALATLGPLPMACEQRDFSPWNVLLTPGGELAVLDWESGEPQGLPVLDLIYFLTYLAASRDGGLTSDRVRNIHRLTLDPTTAIGRVANECLGRYVELVGMDPSRLNPLRLLCWLVHARSEYSRMRDAIGGRPEPSTLGNSLFVALWEQELRMGWGATA